VGAYAIAFYGRPRYTKDMDIFVEPSIENGRRIVTALNRFGFGSLKLTERDFSQKGNIIQLGYEPIRVDIITSLKGCSFTEVWKNRMAGRYGRERVFFIGLKELIKNKKAVGRSQDREDLKILLKFSRKGT
jgi:hypothetical protein